MTFVYAHDAVFEVSVRLSVRCNIFTKLRVADRAQAIVRVREAGPWTSAQCCPMMTLLRGRTDHG
jgi:hypothetical protein